MVSRAFDLLERRATEGVVDHHEADVRVAASESL